MNGGSSEKHLTTETIQFLKTIHQSQITSVRGQQSDENRSSELAIEFLQSNISDIRFCLKDILI